MGPAGLVLGPLAGIAAIITGITASRQHAEDERNAKALEERRKVAMNEIATFQKEGRHGDIEANRDFYTQLGIHPDDLDRAIGTAGRYANSQIALDAENATKSGFSPYMGGPGQLQQAMQMLGQGGPPSTPSPSPSLPSSFADQAQAALPPGAPGQIAAQTALSPQIGGAPWQYPGTEQNGPAQSTAPSPLSEGGQRMTSDASQFTSLPIPQSLPPASGSPNPSQYGSQFDYQGKPITPSTETELITQPIRPEPVVMAERKQFGAPTTTAQPQFGGLQFPKLKTPITRAIDAPGGHVSITDKSPDKGTTTQFMIAQANQHGMSPDELERHYNDWAVTQKGLAPELDHQQLTDYRDQYFGRRLQQITAEIQATTAGRTMDPALIQQSAARAASQEMGNYIPSKGGEAIGFTPEERHLSTINQATGAAAREMEIAARIVDAGGTYKPEYGHSFTDIIDANPSMTPEQKTQIKQQFAATLASRLDQKTRPEDAAGKIQNKMRAAQLTGGIYPHEWEQEVAANPRIWGMSQGMLDMYLTNPSLYSPFTPDGTERLKNAVADEATQGKLFDRALQDPTHAEVYANTANAIKQQPTASPGAPPASPLAGIGPASRAIDVQQREDESAAGVKGTKEAERVEIVKQVAQPLSEVGKALKRFMSFSYAKNPELKAEAGKLYKDILFANRPLIAKGLTMQTGALNENEQEAAISSFSQLMEADLAPRIAQEKIAIINRNLSANFGRPVDILADDPLNPQAPPTIKVDKQGNIISGPKELMDQLKGNPSISPPPPPPTPQPGIPQTAPAQMGSLPPISSTVESAKRAAPTEARPKFGPNSARALQQAADTVPKEVQQQLTRQDKMQLHNAMVRYGQGQLDDRQLELEVAKVLGNVGVGKLEGKALNNAVRTWTDALRNGAQKGKVANGR